MLFLMVLILPSCFEQPDCLLNNTNILKITLKGKTLEKDTTVQFLSIRALEAESELYANKLLGTIQVPLLIRDTIATVVFDYTEKSQLVSDTLVVSYRNQTRVISPDCGAYIYQVGVTIPKTNFEKTRVTTPTLLTTVTKNLEIFL